MADGEGGRATPGDREVSARLINVSPAPSPTVIINVENDADGMSVVSDFEVIGEDFIAQQVCTSDQCLDVELPPAKKTKKKLQFSNTSSHENDIELNEIVPDFGPSCSTADQDEDVCPEVLDLKSMENPLTKLIPPTCKVSETSDIFQTIINRKVLMDVLETRPSVQVGRGRSMRFRARSAFERRPNSAHSSLPTRTKNTLSKPEDGTHTLPNRHRAGIVTVEDIEDDNIVLDDADSLEANSRYKELPMYSKSTLRLKERMDKHREDNLTKSQVVRESPWQNFKSVKWPKLKSQWKVIRSWELWKGHMKKIEGHFGTSIVSYFIFLRFLFLMNLVIFALWFGFVVIPGIIYVIVDRPSNTAPLTTCMYNTADFPGSLCPADDPATALLQTDVPSGESLFYQLVVDGEYTCDPPGTGSTFEVRDCGFQEMTFNDSMTYNQAHVEGGTVLSVSTNQPSSNSCTNASATITVLRHCTSDIAPRILWFSYIIDFVLGQGLYNDTVLFYGRYGNVTVLGNRYSLPLAYLLTTFVVYGISIVWLVIILGNAYNESYTKFSAARRITFSSKVFTAWDFNITNADAAKLKKVHIRTDLEEELSDFDKRGIERTWKDLVIVLIIRLFTNLFTLIVLVGASAAIYYSADYGLRNEGSTFTGFVLPVVVTTLNFILPLLFSLLARFERFKTQGGEIKMTLLRTIIVRLSSLIVLVITLFLLVACTQTVTMDTSTSTCTISPQRLTSALSSNTTSECPTCWETYIGTEFYTLGITNFVVSASATIAAETGRNIVSRFKYKGLGEKIGKGTFNIPKSILDLIYTQALLWLGFFFCPFQPLVILATTFLLFYVKRYSLTINLVPDKRGSFRAARTNFLFVLLMLMTLFLILIPIGFVIGSFNPSESCGPFRGNEFIFSIITNGIDNLPCTSQQFFNFVASVGFVLPVLILLLLIIYALLVSLRARQERFKLVKKQLLLEGANVTHIVSKLDAVLTVLDGDEADGKLPPTVVRQRIIDIRNNLSDQGTREIEEVGNF